MSGFTAEFLGTMFLILLGNGVVAGVSLKKSNSQNSGWIVITVGWSLAVMLPALMFGWISGAHFNPALTLALAVIGEFEFSQVPVFIAAQFLGAFLGQTLVFLAYYLHYKETDDAGAKLATFSTGPAIKDYKFNFLTEVIATFSLVFIILAIGQASMVDGFGTLYVGALIMSMGMSLGGPTGYAMNPARDLGPRIMHQILPVPGKGDSNWGYAWVPVLGPVTGALIGAFAFTMFF